MSWDYLMDRTQCSVEVLDYEKRSLGYGRDGTYDFDWIARLKVKNHSANEAFKIEGITYILKRRRWIFFHRTFKTIPGSMLIQGVEKSILVNPLENDLVISSQGREEIGEPLPRRVLVELRLDIVGGPRRISRRLASWEALQ